MAKIQDLFIEPDRIDAVFFKIITPNDDSGRHGVLIPKEAYGLFPEFPDFDPDAKLNYTHPVNTMWSVKNKVFVRQSNWKHYHRYPERRLTALRSSKLDSAPPNTCIVIGRRGNKSCEYECRVIYPKEPAFGSVLAEFGIESKSVRPGLFGLVLDWKHTTTAPLPKALKLFLEKFDAIHDMGYVKTLRPGDTGIGYTFETLMGIAENNSMKGDFEGIEIKTFRSKDLKSGNSDKMNLFLLEPQWIDGKSPIQRVKDYGYVDEKGRCALYSTVQIKPNSHGFCFIVNNIEYRLGLLRGKPMVAYWEYVALNKRLQEKHLDVVFISAKARGKGSDEEFWYQTVTHCSNPSVDAFLSLLNQGDVLLELRMHVEILPREKMRNHGSGFRIKKNRIPMLYGSTTQHRNYENTDK